MMQQFHLWEYSRENHNLKRYTHPSVSVALFMIVKTCTPKFIAALFTMAKTKKQPKNSLTDEWIKKMRYKYTMGYYSVIQRMK